MKRLRSVYNVTTGLDPVAQAKQSRLFGTMDPRIKSAGDGFRGALERSIDKETPN